MSSAAALRCPSCGKRSPQSAGFCAYCGRSFAPPRRMPPLRLGPTALRHSLVAAAGGALVGMAFWLLAGALAGMSLEARLALGGAAGALGAGSAVLLRAQLLWPLAGAGAGAGGVAGQRLAWQYGLGGGLSLVAGAWAIGALVLLAAWRAHGAAGAPLARVAASGVLGGTVGLALSAPPAALLGMALGWLLAWPGGRLGRAGLAAAAGLAWLLAASAGGAWLGALLALRAGLEVSAGAQLGGALQTALGAVLLPVGARLMRAVTILGMRLF